MQEILSTTNTLSYLYDFNSNWQNTQFRLVPNSNARGFTPSSQSEIVQIKPWSGGAPHRKGQVPVYTNSIQYQGVLALHLMNRLILLNRFDVIEKIYKKIIDRYFNMDAIIKRQYSTMAQKKTLLGRYIDVNRLNKLTEPEMTDLFSQVVEFKTFLAPFEGIYINESIMGLIKVLSRKILKKTNGYIKSNLMEEQDKTLDFGKQKEQLRLLNIFLYDSEPSAPNREINSQHIDAKYYDVIDKYNSNIRRSQYENIFRDDYKLDVMYENNKKGYSSQKIFNYDKPSITPMINLYTKERYVTVDSVNRKIVAIKDFKLFYLFSNTQMPKKCSHQWKLLRNTLSFIKAIESNYD